MNRKQNCRWSKLETKDWQGSQDISDFELLISCARKSDCCLTKLSDETYWLIGADQLLVMMIGCNDKRKWWQREGCYDKVILCARRESSPIHFLNTSFSPSLPIFPLQDGTFLQRSCDKVFTFIQIWCDKDFKLLVDVREIWESSTLINTFPLDCKQQEDGDYLQQMVENGRREIKYPDSWRI